MPHIARHTSYCFSHMRDAVILSIDAISSPYYYACHRFEQRSFVYAIFLRRSPPCRRFSLPGYFRWHHHYHAHAAPPRLAPSYATDGYTPRWRALRCRRLRQPPRQRPLSIPDFPPSSTPNTQMLMPYEDSFAVACYTVTRDLRYASTYLRYRGH